MRTLSLLFFGLVSLEAGALCAIPEIDQICGVAPLGDTCFVGVLNGRDIDSLTMTVDDVFGENPLDLVEDQRAVFLIDASYFRRGAVGTLLSVIG